MQEREHGDLREIATGNLDAWKASGVVKTLRYRPEFFGAQMRDLFQEVMRGPSAWSVADRELMAAYVSRVNACDF